MQSKSLLVFPTSRAIRNYVTHDSSNRLLTPLLSIDDFFLKSITIGHDSFIDEEHRFLLLKEATEIKNFKALGISNHFNDFIKQSEYIFRFFNELSAENIAFDAIKKAANGDNVFSPEMTARLVQSLISPAAPPKKCSKAPAKTCCPS